MKVQTLEQKAKSIVMEKLIKLIDKYPDKPLNRDIISKNLFIKEHEIEYQIVLKKLKFKHIEEELIKKTWHPSRFQEWCLDEGEKKDNEEE